MAADRNRIDARGRRSVVAAAACLAALLAVAEPAVAQKDSILTVGVAASIYDATNTNVENPTGVGVVARLRRSSGVGVTVGFDWFKSNVFEDVGGERTQVASLRMRPVMAGLALTKQYSRFAVSGSMVVGYSFNGIGGTGAGQSAYARQGQPGTTFAVGNCLAYRPDFSIWWELGNHFGLLTSVSYMGARPTLTTRSPLGVSSRTVNAGAPMLTVGIGYGIF